jgi:hypothetical protein
MVTVGGVEGDVAVWDPEGATRALSLLYGRLLGRDVDPANRAAWAAHLVDRGGTLRHVVAEVGASREYFDRWTRPPVTAGLWWAPVATYYRHFLDREPESAAVVGRHAARLGRAIQAGGDGFEAHRELVRGLVGGDEYGRRWGDQGIPGIGPPGAPVPAPFAFCVTFEDGQRRTFFAAGVGRERAEAELRRRLAAEWRVAPAAIHAGPC